MATARSSRWYGPTDTWPKHSKPWFKRALTKARRHGWYFCEFSDHSFGRVYCGLPQKIEDPCYFLVFSSGSGGESAARELEKLVDQCPHQREEKMSVIWSLIRKIEGLVLAAQRLLERSDLIKDSEAAYQRAEELMEYAEAETEVVEKMIEADEDLRRADEIDQEVAEALDQIGVQERSVKDLVEAAETTVAEVKAEIRQLPASSQAKALRDRIKNIEAKLKNLRDRLTT